MPTTHIVVGGLFLVDGLNGVGEKAEHGADPQQHGETAKQLQTRVGVQSVCLVWLVAELDVSLPAYIIIIICIKPEEEEGLDFTCLQNLTHSGVVGGGVRALGPSRARISLALELERP